MRKTDEELNRELSALFDYDMRPNLYLWLGGRFIDDEKSIQYGGRGS
jgi:hypothetical protein